MKKILSAVFLAVLFPIASCSAESDTAPSLDRFVEGKDYSLLARPVRTADPSKIEVTEIFWYGCIHCFRLEPELEEWLPEQADDVNFVHLPAIWAEQMELHAAMLYANQALGLTDQLHGLIFEEMNVNGNKMPTEADILEFVSDQGIDAEKYRRALNSFGVNSQVQQARAKMGAYGVRGTPEMVINGKYKLTTAMSGSFQRMLEIADELIERERRAMAAAE